MKIPLSLLRRFQPLPPHRWTVVTQGHRFEGAVSRHAVGMDSGGAWAEWEFQLPNQPPQAVRIRQFPGAAARVEVDGAATTLEPHIRLVATLVPPRAFWSVQCGDWEFQGRL